MIQSAVIVYSVLDGRQSYLQPRLSGRILYQEKMIAHGLDQYRGEVVTSRCHGSKTSDENKPKCHLKSGFALFQTWSI